MINERAFDINVVVKGEVYRFAPKDDMTPVEAARFTQLLMSLAFGTATDAIGFIHHFGLERHFEVKGDK